MIDTSHMTPLEEKLGDFIMTRSKTRGQSLKKNPIAADTPAVHNPPAQNLPMTMTIHTDKHRSPTANPTGQKSTPPTPTTLRPETPADITSTTRTRVPAPPPAPTDPPHDPIGTDITLQPPLTYHEHAGVHPTLHDTSYTDEYDTASNADTDSINLPSVIAPVPAPAPHSTQTYAAMVLDTNQPPSTGPTPIVNLQRQLNQLQMVIQTQQLEIATLRDSTHTAIQTQVKTQVALLANSTDYREIVRTTFETWQTSLQSRADASKKRNHQIDTKYRDWTTKLHRQVATLDDQMEQQKDTLRHLMNDHRKSLSKHVVDAQLEAEQLRALIMNELQTSIHAAETQFTNWAQVARQKELDTVREEFEELRTDCFKQIDDEFEVQAQNLRSDMDCIREEVKHLTREGLDNYRDTLLRHAHPPPPQPVPPDDRTPTSNSPDTPTHIPHDPPIIDLVTPPPVRQQPGTHGTGSTSPPSFVPPPNPPYVPLPVRPPAWAPNVDIASLHTTTTTRPTHREHPVPPLERPSVDTRGEKYFDPEYQLTRLRKSTPSMQLTGTTREAVHSFYNSFVDFLDSHRIPIRPLMALRPNEPAFPDTALDPTLLHRYSAAIYTRLEEPGVLDTRISRYKGLLQQHNETRDGYMVLQQLLRPHIDHVTLNNFVTVPVYGPTDSIYTFAANMTKYFTDQRRRYRHYGKREQALMYLQGILADQEYTDAAKSILTDLAKLDPAYDDLDPKYYMESLPGTVEAHRTLTQPYATVHPRINATSTRAHQPRDTRPRHRTDSSMHRTPSSNSNRPRPPVHGSTGTSTRLDAQCEACGMYGHQDPSSCTFLPRVALCMEYLDKHAKNTKGLTQAWKHRNNPKVKNLMKEQMIKQLQVHLSDRSPQEITDIATSIIEETDLPTYQDHSDWQGTGTADDPILYYDSPPSTDLHDTQHGAIAYPTPVSDSIPTYQYRLYCTNAPNIGSTHTTVTSKLASYRAGIHPVHLPPVQYPHHPEPFFYSPDTVRHQSPAHPSDDTTGPTTTLVVKKLVRIDPRVHHLADTGANFSVTDDPSYLHDYTTDTLFETTGYDGVTRKATGHGIMKILNNFGQMEQHTVIHSADTDGTIISMEHFAKSNPSIHKWEQSSIPSENRGWITFSRKDGTIVSQLNTIRHNGLYYLTNLRIIPPSPQQICTATTLPTKNSVTVSTIGDHTTVPDTPCTSTSVPDSTSTTPYSPATDGMDTVGSQQHSTTPSLSTAVPITDDTPSWPTVHGASTLSHDFELNMETEYIPSLLHSTTPGHCTPATVHHICVGTTQTAQAKPTTPLEKDIINYEIWHQRLAHVSEDKLRKTQQCAHGIPPFTTTLLPNLIRCRICDIARLQKAPRGPPQHDPPDLQPGQMFQIDIGFFRGPENLADVVDRKAEPSMKVIESRQGYVCYLLIIDRKTRKVWIFPLKSRAVPMPLICTFLRIHGNHEQNLPRWIRTDGEGALAHSALFRSDILTEFGYLIELTATDASSQNALAERPHKTFGLMVRCLLYSSRLPVIFWADAYVYANYIYDRLYHSAIGKTPYEAWTNTQPSLQHIRAFGAHVIVKRGGHRPTKADPHFYDGYFLRFAATSKNIIYWDPITKREKLARHCVVDEFHFGSEHSARPPGAAHVLQTLLPTLATTVRPNSSSILVDETSHEHCPHAH